MEAEKDWEARRNNVSSAESIGVKNNLKAILEQFKHAMI
jgi:hypothetical protein